MSDREDDEIEYIFRNEMGRRDFLLDMLAMGGLAAGMSLPGRALAQAMTPPDDEVVRIGYIPITDAAALLVAYANGYFQDEGLKVERPTLIRGWSPLVEAFSAGKFNLVHLLIPIPVWMRYNNHYPVKIMGWAHVNGSAVVVGKHLHAESFKDLAGKQIAVPYWYSIHNILIQMALRQYGLKPVIKRESDKLAPNEVNLLVLPPPSMPPALASRKIDAYVVAEPFNAAGELLAGGKILRFTGDMWKNHPCCVVCMHDHHVNKNPVWTQKVMNAVTRAELYAEANKKEVAHMLSRDGKGFLPMPAKVVERAMTDYHVSQYEHPPAIQHEAEWHNGRIDFQPYPYPTATRMIVEQMRHTEVGGSKAFLDSVKTEHVVKDLVDYRFVKKAMEQNMADWKRLHERWWQGKDASDPFVRTEVIEI